MESAYKNPENSQYNYKGISNRVTSATSSSTCVTQDTKRSSSSSNRLPGFHSLRSNSYGLTHDIRDVFVWDSGSLRKPFDNVSTERDSLPPASQKGRQLVASDQWTIYRPEGSKFQVHQLEGALPPPKKKQSRSLPNSSFKNEAPPDDLRQITSAPYHRGQGHDLRKGQSRPPGHLPKVNSLVNGTLDAQLEKKDTVYDQQPNKGKTLNRKQVPRKTLEKTKEESSNFASKLAVLEAKNKSIVRDLSPERTVQVTKKAEVRTEPPKSNQLPVTDKHHTHVHESSDQNKQLTSVVNKPKPVVEHKEDPYLVRKEDFTRPETTKPSKQHEETHVKQTNFHAPLVDTEDGTSIEINEVPEKIEIKEKDIPLVREHPRPKPKQNFVAKFLPAQSQTSNLKDSAAPKLIDRSKTVQIRDERPKFDLTKRAKSRTFVGWPKKQPSPTSPTSLERNQTPKILLASEREELNAKKKEEPPKKSSTKDAVNLYTRGNARLKGKTQVKKQDLKGKRKDVASDGPYNEAIQKVPPWHRGEYILTKNEASMYKSIKKVYGSEKIRKDRENQFFRKLMDLQLEEWKRLHKEFMSKQYKKMETKFQQQSQLKKLRERFEQEQVERFRSQYVTSKVIEHEWNTRHVYGLPEDIDGQPQHKVKLRGHDKRPKETFSYKEHHEMNLRKFKSMFREATKSLWASDKDPKMEGIDTVQLTTADGKTNSTKKANVADVIKDAEKLLESGGEAEENDDPSLSLSDTDDNDISASPKAIITRGRPTVRQPQVQNQNVSPSKSSTPLHKSYSTLPGKNDKHSSARQSNQRNTSSIKNQQHKTSHERMNQHSVQLLGTVTNNSNLQAAPNLYLKQNPIDKAARTSKATQDPKPKEKELISVRKVLPPRPTIDWRQEMNNESNKLSSQENESEANKGSYPIKTQETEPKIKEDVETSQTKGGVIETRKDTPEVVDDKSQQNMCGMKTEGCEPIEKQEQDSQPKDAIEVKNTGDDRSNQEGNHKPGSDAKEENDPQPLVLQAKENVDSEDTIETRPRDKHREGTSSKVEVKSNRPEDVELKINQGLEEQQRNEVKPTDSQINVIKIEQPSSLDIVPENDSHPLHESIHPEPVLPTSHAVQESQQHWTETLVRTPSDKARSQKEVPDNDMLNDNDKPSYSNVSQGLANVQQEAHKNISKELDEASDKKSKITKPNVSEQKKAPKKKDNPHKGTKEAASTLESKKRVTKLTANDSSVLKSSEENKKNPKESKTQKKSEAGKPKPKRANELIQSTVYSKDSSQQRKSIPKGIEDNPLKRETPKVLDDNPLKKSEKMNGKKLAQKEKTRPTIIKKEEKNKDKEKKEPLYLAERPDVPDDELRLSDESDEEEDIFEKARRKYGIIIDESDDD